MARGDSIFGRIDVSLLMDARWRKLPSAGKVTYLTIYLTAVEHRRSILPTQYDQVALADRTGLDRRTYEKALQKCVEVGFIKLTNDNRVFVPDVKENHEKMKWNDSGICPDALPHIGPTKGSEREEKIEKKEKKEETDEQVAVERSLSRELAPPSSANPEQCNAIVQNVLYSLKKQENLVLMQPPPELVEFWFNEFDPSKPGCKPYELMKVVSHSRNGTKVFNEARQRLSDDVIRQQCAYIEALRELNPNLNGEAGAILINRLNDLLARCGKETTTEKSASTVR